MRGAAAVFTILMIAAPGGAAPGIGISRADDDILFRRDANGTLVLTNVPNHDDLKRFRAGRGAASALRADRFRWIIESAAIETGIHPDLLLAVTQVESNFDPTAVSVKGAQGLMQLMPETASSLGVSDPFDPVENVRGGARHLRRLLDLFGGDKRLALAAYNAGETAVLEKRGIPPYRETREYVRKVLRLFGEGRAPYREERSRPRRGAGDPEGPAIFRYVDERGVVHYTDQPPPPADTGAEAGTAPR